MSASTIALDVGSTPTYAQRRFSQWGLRTLLLTSDVLALFLSFVFATLLVHLLNIADGGSAGLRWLTTMLTLPLLFLIVGLYQSVGMNPTAELKRLTVTTSTGFLLLLLVYMQHTGPAPSRAFILAWILALVLVPSLRSAARSLGGRFRWFGYPTVLFGSGEAGQAIAALLEKKKGFGFRLTAVLDADIQTTSFARTDLLVGHFSLSSELSRTARHAIIATADFPKAAIEGIIRDHARYFDYILLIPDITGLSSLWVTAKDLGGVLALEVSQKLMRRNAQIMKRTYDILISGFLIVVLAPLFVLVALMIRLTSPGPVFYGQKRIGRNSKLFTMWKFRSMRTNSEAILSAYLASNSSINEQWQRDHKLRDDPRVTRIGRLIRKASIDELPQLWNVFTGSMSLVGPRPIVEAEVTKYQTVFEDYLRVKPGITGLWQVSGRNNTSYEERVQYDRYYVQNWCVWLDVHILCSTLNAVLFARGAY